MNHARGFPKTIFWNISFCSRIITTAKLLTSFEILNSWTSWIVHAHVTSMKLTNFFSHFPTTVSGGIVHTRLLDIIVDITYPFRGVHQYPTRAWCSMLFQRFTISFPGFSSVLFLDTLQDSGQQNATVDLVCQTFGSSALSLLRFLLAMFCLNTA